MYFKYLSKNTNKRKTGLTQKIRHLKRMYLISDHDIIFIIAVVGISKFSVWPKLKLQKLVSKLALVPYVVMQVEIAGHRHLCPRKARRRTGRRASQCLAVTAVTHLLLIHMSLTTVYIYTFSPSPQVLTLRSLVGFPSGSDSKESACNSRFYKT